MLHAHSFSQCFCAAEWPEAQRELTDGPFGAMQFRAEPATGVLEAGQEADFSLTFSPAAQHRLVDTYCIAPDGSLILHCTLSLTFLIAV